MTQKDRILASLREQVEQAADRIAENIERDVIENTPVDTGRAQ